MLYFLFLFLLSSLPTHHESVNTNPQSIGSIKKLDATVLRVGDHEHVGVINTQTSGETGSVRPSVMSSQRLQEPVIHSWFKQMDLGIDEGDTQGATEINAETEWVRGESCALDELVTRCSTPRGDSLVEEIGHQDERRRRGRRGIEVRRPRASKI